MGVDEGGVYVYRDPFKKERTKRDCEPKTWTLDGKNQQMKHLIKIYEIKEI